MQKVSFPKHRPQVDLGDIEKKKNTLEYKTIMFTVVLYFFVCFGLLAVHYLSPLLPKAPALLEAEAEAASGSDSGNIRLTESSSGSPHNPHVHKKKSGHGETGHSEAEKSETEKSK